MYLRAVLAPFDVCVILRVGMVGIVTLTPPYDADQRLNTMRKTPSLVLLFFVMVICSCSLIAEKKPADWPALQWENQSVTLRIIGSDGKPISAYSGSYFSVPGYIFVADQISLHPGTHRISYSCPGEWDWKMVSHYIPAIEHKFEVGESYELYCVNGYPKIRLSD